MAPHACSTLTAATPHVRVLGEKILAQVAFMRALLNAAHRDSPESPLFGNGLSAIYQLYREHESLVQSMSDYTPEMGKRLQTIAADADRAIDHLKAVVSIRFTSEQLAQYKDSCEKLRALVTDWQFAAK